MQLTEALGLDPSLRSQLTDAEFHTQLRHKFAAEYPTIITPGKRGYAKLEGKLDNRVRLALHRMGIVVEGSLELLSHKDIAPLKPQDRTGLGEHAIEVIARFLRQKGKRLRQTNVSYREASKTAFGRAGLVPVEWLTFKKAIALAECQDLLLDWGIRCLGDISNIPRSRLLLLTSPGGHYGLEKSKLEKIHNVMKEMNLRMK